MKKLLLFLLCAVLCLALCSCSGNGSSAPAAPKADTATPTPAPTATPEPAFEPLDWATVTEAPAANFAYELSWDEESYRITAYNGTDAIVKVPAAIEGKPVTGLGEDLFRSNETITHVYLPDTVRYMGDSCFNNCPNLVQLHLPANLSEIAQATCKECRKLVQVDLPTALTSIRQSAFSECISLKEIELPATTTYMEKDVFDGCRSLTSFKAPGLKQMGQCALRDCVSLTELVLYEGMGLFNGNALNGCTSLTDLTLMPLTEESSYRVVFENGILYDVYGTEEPEYTALRMLPGYPADAVQLHPNTTKLEHSVFYGCQLRSIEIPAAVDTIPGNAFVQCRNLESITFAPGSQLRLLEMNCFSGCTALTAIDLSFVTEQLTMYSGAFGSNDALTSVKLPANVNATDPADYMFRSAKNVVISYQGKDYTYDQLSELKLVQE